MRDLQRGRRPKFTGGDAGWRLLFAFGRDWAARAAQFSRWARTMNLSKVLVAFAVSFAPFVGKAQLTMSVRLLPQNVSAYENYIFTVETGEGKSALHISASNMTTVSFSVSITRKGTEGPSAVEAELIEFDGESEITHMPVENLRTGHQAYRYEFVLATNFLAYSQFVFRERRQASSGRRYSGDSFWFFLKDFVPDKAPNPQGGANGRQPSGSETNRTSSAASPRSP